MRGERDRLRALADELNPGKVPPARRSYVRSFDDGTTIELQTAEEIYRPRTIPAVEGTGENDNAQELAPAPTQAQGFSHFRALRASWSPGVRQAAGLGRPRDHVSRRRARRRRRRAEERSPIQALGRPAALAADLAAAPARPGDAEEMLLDPEVLKNDLEGLTSRSGAPPTDAGAPTAAPTSDGEPTAPPKLTHEVFDDLRRGQAGAALAAMKSASKTAGLSHAIFDSFPRSLSQAAKYDVGTFDVKRRFDDLDRQLEAAWTPPPRPAASSEGPPTLLPFELRADLDQMRARGEAAAAPPQVLPPEQSKGVDQ